MASVPAPPRQPATGWFAGAVWGSASLLGRGLLQSLWSVQAGAVGASNCCEGWQCTVAAAMLLGDPRSAGNWSSRGLWLARLWRRNCCTYCSVPMGAPSTVRPCWVGGSSRLLAHVSGPRLWVLAGWWPPRFQIRVLPWLRRMWACASRWLANKSYTRRTRSGCTTAYMSSRKAYKVSPGWSCACTACSAGCWPKENKAGIKGFPCSPPSAWVILCQCLSTSCCFFKPKLFQCLSTSCCFF